jgi:hypothetical protein
MGHPTAPRRLFPLLTRNQDGYGVWNEGDHLGRVRGVKWGDDMRGPVVSGIS